MIHHIVCENCDKEADKKRTDDRIPRYCSRPCYLAGHKKEKQAKRTSTNYWTVHRRVRNDRGRASQYKCVTCGNQARDWAMRHGTDGSDPAMFDPMCRSCHIAYDGTAAVFSANAKTQSASKQRDSQGRFVA